MDYKQVMNCRVCGSHRLKKYLDLGCVPLCNKLLKNHNQEYNTYPIQLLLCGDCALSQLSIVVNPEILYRDYAYHSSVSNTFKKHCYDMAIHLKSKFELKPYPLVLDIASNDGCLLEQFREAGFNRLLGVEPSHNLASQYFFKRIPVIHDFWSERTAKYSFGGGGVNGSTQGASIITATNVFAHCDDLVDFLKGIDWYLDTNGVFVVEVPYFYNLINSNQFDTIYHEHLSYFLFHPLKLLFDRNNFPIFKVEQYPIHGGSLRIYASRNYYSEESSVTDLLAFEANHKLHDIEIYQNFSSKINKIQGELRMTLEVIHHAGKKVMGYGASAKGISLLNYSNIPGNYIHSIVDETSYKQGMWTPGTSIPIVPFEQFEKEKPDFILLLAWNFADELIEKTKHIGARYIIPIPEVKVI